MKTKVQAQRKFAQGAYVPPCPNVTNSSVNNRVDTTNGKPKRYLFRHNTSARILLDSISFESIHKHNPIVLLERLQEQPIVQMNDANYASNELLTTAVNNVTTEEQEPRSPKKVTSLRNIKQNNASYICRKPRNVNKIKKSISKRKPHKNYLLKCARVQKKNQRCNMKLRSAAPSSVVETDFSIDDDKPLMFYTKKTFKHKNNIIKQNHNKIIKMKKDVLIQLQTPHNIKESHNNAEPSCSKVSLENKPEQISSRNVIQKRNETVKTKNTKIRKATPNPDEEPSSKKANRNVSLARRRTLNKEVSKCKGTQKKYKRNTTTYKESPSNEVTPNESAKEVTDCIEDENYEEAPSNAPLKTQLALAAHICSESNRDVTQLTTFAQSCPIAREINNSVQRQLSDATNKNNTNVDKNSAQVNGDIHDVASEEETVKPQETTHTSKTCSFCKTLIKIVKSYQKTIHDDERLTLNSGITISQVNDSITALLTALKTGKLVSCISSIPNTNKEKQVKDRKQTVACKEKQVMERRQSVACQEKQIKERRQSVAYQEKQVKERRQSVAYQEKQVKERRQSVAYQEKQVKERRQSVAYQEKQVKERRQSVAYQEKQVKERRQSVAYQEKQVKERRQSVTCQEKPLKERRKSVFYQEDQINDRKQSDVSKDTKLNERRESVSKQEEEDKKRRQSVSCEEKTETVTQKENQARERRDSVTCQENQIKERRQAVTFQEKPVRERTRSVTFQDMPTKERRHSVASTSFIECSDPTETTDAENHTEQKETRVTTRRMGKPSNQEKEHKICNIVQGKIVEAPAFRPTEAEFRDPVAYFQKITPEAAKYGMCKVIAPPGFKPTCTINDTIRFVVTNQYLARFYSRWGPVTRELCALRSFLASQNIIFSHSPLLEGLEVNLPKILHFVQRQGGLKENVESRTYVDTRKWNKLADELNYSKLNNPAKKLDQIYVKYLLPYDALTQRERQELTEKMDSKWTRRNDKLIRRAQNPLHRQKRLLGESDSSDDDDFEDNQHMTAALNEAEECVVRGRVMNLANFKKIAATALKIFFPSTPSTSEIEARYWKLVLLGNEHVCVNTASIDTGVEGYGFSKSKNDPYAKHPWNLKMLSQNPGNVLRSLGPVLGVTVPTLHVGMIYSTSCWHRDPHGLPWIEYMHTGPEKIWYGIPDSESTKFRHAVESLCPTACQNKSIWLPSDIAMIPPTLLLERNVSMSRVVQKPGEYVIVFPKAYSCSICTGYTVSESVYFATNSWVKSVNYVFRELRKSCEPTMFSLEQLLIAVARDQNASLTMLQLVHESFSAILSEELENRRLLERLGLKPVIIESESRSAADAWNVHENECEVCRSTLYLSRVKGVFRKRYSVCLRHALQVLDSKNKKIDMCEKETFELEYFFSSTELEEVISSVIERLTKVT